MMEATARYFFFADRFGWTSDQVDGERAWLVDRLPTVAAVHRELEEERLEESRRDAKGAGR